MNSLRRLLASAVLMLALPSVTFANSNPLPAITIEGEIAKIVSSEKEIYVRNPEGMHEFYFNKNTSVQIATSTGSYDDLKKGQKVRVTANKIGKRLDPVTVEILQ